MEHRRGKKKKEEKGRKRKKKEEKGRERKKKEEKGRKSKNKEEKGRTRKKKEQKGRKRKKKEEKGKVTADLGALTSLVTCAGSCFLSHTGGHSRSFPPSLFCGQQLQLTKGCVWKRRTRVAAVG